MALKSGAMRRLATHWSWFCLLPAGTVLLLERWAPRLVDQIMSVVMVLIGATFALALPVAAWAILQATRTLLIRWRLLRNGLPVSARVVEARAYGLPIPTVDDVVIADLQLEIVSGASPRRLCLSERMDVESMPSAGDHVTLLIDPQRLDRFRLAPMDRPPP